MRTPELVRGERVEGQCGDDHGGKDADGGDEPDAHAQEISPQSLRIGCDAHDERGKHAEEAYGDHGCRRARHHRAEVVAALVDAAIAASGGSEPREGTVEDGEGGEQNRDHRKSSIRCARGPRRESRAR